MSKLSGWHECHYCHTVFPINGFGYMSIIKHHWYCNQDCYRRELQEQQEDRKHAHKAGNAHATS